MAGTHPDPVRPQRSESRCGGGRRLQELLEDEHQLIRMVGLDEQGQPVYRRPLWLLVRGDRQVELSLIQAWEAYGQRFDLEMPPF